jgi:hypothetical protein
VFSEELNGVLLFFFETSVLELISRIYINIETSILLHIHVIPGFWYHAVIQAMSIAENDPSYKD